MEQAVQRLRQVLDRCSCSMSGHLVFSCPHAGMSMLYGLNAQACCIPSSNSFSICFAVHLKLYLVAWVQAEPESWGYLALLPHSGDSCRMDQSNDEQQAPVRHESDASKVNERAPMDCMSCRVTGVVVCVACSAFPGAQVLTLPAPKPPHKAALLTFAAGFAAMGIVRAVI